MVFILFKVDFRVVLMVIDSGFDCGLYWFSMPPFGDLLQRIQSDRCSARLGHCAERFEIATLADSNRLLKA